MVPEGIGKGMVQVIVLLYVVDFFLFELVKVYTW